MSGYIGNLVALCSQITLFTSWQLYTSAYHTRQIKMVRGVQPMTFQTLWHSITSVATQEAASTVIDLSVCMYPHYSKVFSILYIIQFLLNLDNLLLVTLKWMTLTCPFTNLFSH